MGRIADNSTPCPVKAGRFRHSEKMAFFIHLAKEDITTISIGSISTTSLETCKKFVSNFFL